jgi:acetylornithine/succinyldiaminopimelate/putrescine aminotransferase
MTILTGQDWLVNTLLNDATLTGLGVTRVYAGDAPFSAVYPFIEVRFVNGNPLMNNAAAIVWLDEIYDVKCVDKSESWAKSISIADRILALLHGKTEQVQGSGVMVGCSVEDKIQYSETDELKTFIHLGYTFRVYSR